MGRFEAPKYAVVQRGPFGRVRILHVTEDHDGVFRAYELPRFILVSPWARDEDLRWIYRLLEGDAQRHGGRHMHKALIVPRGRVRSWLLGLPRYKECQNRQSAIYLAREWRGSEICLRNIASFIGSRLPKRLRRAYAVVCACAVAAVGPGVRLSVRHDTGWLE